MKIVFTILLSAFCIVCFSQSYKTVYEVVSITEPQIFYLNSKLRLGGKTRNSIKVDLPENTIQWSYVFTTSLSKQSSQINLKDQLSDMVSSLPGGIAAGLTVGAISQIIKPTGAGVVDVYLARYEEYLNFNNGESFSYIIEGSRENFKEGSILVDDIKSGSAFICFKNPSPTEGIYVIVEVAAIVAKKEYVDEWTLENKQKLINSGEF